jgi:hypothetical protein
MDRHVPNQRSDVFFTTLFAWHYAVGAQAQLETLWVEHVSKVLHEDDDVPLDSGSRGGAGGVEVSKKAATLLDSQCSLIHDMISTVMLQWAGQIDLMHSAKRLNVTNTESK